MVGKVKEFIPFSEGKNVLPLDFLNKISMGNKTKLIHVQDMVSLYSTMDTINKFHHHIRFSNIEHEEDMIMEPY